MVIFVPFTIKKLFLLFVVGSIFGTIYEELLTLTRNFIKTGKFSYEKRRGLLYGPFNPVYGLGAVLLVSFVKANSLISKFLLSTLIGGMYEYLASFIQELFTKTLGWNYHENFLNINGRTTIPFMFFWGLLGILLIEIIYPLFEFMVFNLSSSFIKFITYFLLLIIIPDIFITFSALIRSKRRRENKKTYTFIGKLCDKYYSDTRLLYYLPNLIYIE